MVAEWELEVLGVRLVEVGTLLLVLEELEVEPRVAQGE